MKRIVNSKNIGLLSSALMLGGTAAAQSARNNLSQERSGRRFPNKMKKGLLGLFIGLSVSVYGQIAESPTQENRNLVFDSTDLKIIQWADALLSNKSKWHKQDDRDCDDDIANKKYSLYCALYQASVEITGEYIHRRPAMQIVRFTVEKYENGREKDHRLKDWNNHPDTSFEEVKKVLKESINAVKITLTFADEK